MTAALILLLAFLAAQDGPSETDFHSLERNMAAGRYAEAARAAQAMIQKDSRAAPEVYAALIECLMSIGQRGRALAEADTALEVHPNSPLILKIAGQLLFTRNPEDPRAGDLLGKASAAAPSDPEAHHFYAEWAFLNRRDEIAVAEANRVLQLAPENALARLQAYTLLGLAFDRMKREAESDEAFRKAFAINRTLKPFDARSAIEYVRVLNRAGRTVDAQRIVDEVLRLAPGYGPAHLEKAKQYDAAQESKQAIREAERALTLEGTDKTELRAAHVLLARLYFELGQDAKAEYHQKWVEANQPK